MCHSQYTQDVSGSSCGLKKHPELKLENWFCVSLSHSSFKPLQLIKWDVLNLYFVICFGFDRCDQSIFRCWVGFEWCHQILQFNWLLFFLCGQLTFLWLFGVDVGLWVVHFLFINSGKKEEEVGLTDFSYFRQLLWKALLIIFINEYSVQYCMPNTSLDAPFHFPKCIGSFS